MTAIVQYLLKSSSCCQDANTYCFHILEYSVILPQICHIPMKMKSKIKSSLALYLLTLRVHSQWLCCCWQSLFAACVLLLLLIVGWYFVAEISSWDILLYFTGDTDTINYREPEWRVVSCPAQSCLMLPNRRMTAQPESHSSSHCSLYDLETIYSVHIGQKDHVQLLTSFIVQRLLI